MSNFAQIENNVVVNLVVADQEWIDLQAGEWIEYSDPPQNDEPTMRPKIVDIGWQVIDGVITDPYETTQ
jgi:hypothetical protein